MSASDIQTPVPSSTPRRPFPFEALAVGVGPVLLSGLQSADVYAPLAVALCGLGVGLLAASVAAARSPREGRVRRALRAGLAAGLGGIIAAALIYELRPW